MFKNTDFYPTIFGLVKRVVAESGWIETSTNPFLPHVLYVSGGNTRFEIIGITQDGRYQTQITAYSSESEQPKSVQVIDKCCPMCELGKLLKRHFDEAVIQLSW